MFYQMLNYNCNLLNAAPSTSSVVLTGIVIVFSMLLLFVLLFTTFGKIMTAVTGPKKEKTKSVKRKLSPASNVSAAPKAVVTAASEDNDEIIAVISAAVYSMYEGSSKRPVIKSIKPASHGGKSAWAMAGIYDNIRSF